MVAACVWASVAMAASAQAQDGPSVDVGGDLALRYHGLFFTNDGGDAGDTSRVAINRPETRASLLVNASGSKTLKAQLRLSTGGANIPSVRWRPAAAWGRRLDARIDRAWIGAAPEMLPELEVRLGSWNVPWSRTGLVWEPDLNLPGLLAHYRREGSAKSVWEEMRADVAVVYLASGTAEPNDETFMAVAQLGARFRLAGKTRLEVDLGYIDVSDTKRLGMAIARGDIAPGGGRPAGFTANTTATDAEDASAELTQRLVVDGLASDFNVFTAYTALWVDLAEHLPSAIFINAAWNAGASGPGEGEALGLDAGIQLGRADRPGRGQLRLRWLYIQADAVLDLFNRALLASNTTGPFADAQLKLWKGWTAGFEVQYTRQINADLRGLGDTRNDPLPGDPTTFRTTIFTGYAF